MEIRWNQVVLGQNQVVWSLRSQFLWGDHGLAMAHQELGHFEEAAQAYRRCLELVALAAPGSEWLRLRILL